MDILRNLFGNLTSGIIRLLVTVGILAAAYFFIVKPVLKTTDNAIKSTNRRSRARSEEGLNDIGKALDDVNHQVKVQVRRSYHAARRHGNPKKLVHCVELADGNAHKIQAMRGEVLRALADAVKARLRPADRRHVTAPQARDESAAVEARPGLAGGELALEPVEAAEAAAEVVDHVDQDRLAGGRDDRGAVLELAVVAEDDVEDGLGEVGVEAVDRPRSRGAPCSSRAGSRPRGGRRR